ncbi:MAG: thiol peroxidase [Candidatus Wallbacteria bacterium]|nr:thiol peroxidase [Candidatus Wallbacteria bacterium]
MPRTVTMKGQTLELTGPELKIGVKAPAFSLLDQDMNVVTLADFPRKIKVLSVTPSLDTPVCDLQIRRFNQEATKHLEAVVLNISMDLPFAIKRFCSANGLDRVKALSDHRTADFGNDYGVLISGLRLLARAVIVIDSGDVVRFVQIVPELTEQPDYTGALECLANM